MFKKPKQRFKGSLEEIIQQITAEIEGLDAELKEIELKNSRGVYRFFTDWFSQLEKEIDALYHDKAVNRADIPDEIRGIITNDLWRRCYRLKLKNQERACLNLLRSKLSFVKIEIQKQGGNVEKQINIFNDHCERYQQYIQSQEGKKELAEIKGEVDKLAENLGFVTPEQ